MATVSNSQMEDMQSLVGRFTEKAGIGVEFLFLPENDLCQKVTQKQVVRGLTTGAVE